MSQTKDGCLCGQVIFDLSGRKPGETLSCPWCHKTYSYSEAGALEPLARPGAPGTEKREISAPPTAKPAAEVLQPGGEKKSKRSGRRYDITEVPGGIMRMIIFIVVFNAAAFIALAYVLPKQPDGLRHNPWGAPIPKTALWPEMAALLLGHVVGFIAWSFNVYRLQMKRFKTLQTAKASAAQNKS
jgi:hypothetical protein